MGLRLAGVPLWRTAAAALLASLIIESLQLRIVSGRDASLSDLLANASGGTLGALLAHRWRALVHPSGSRARTLAILATGTWIGVVLLTAWSVRRSIPLAGYWVQWERLGSRPDRFTGLVLGTAIRGHDLPAGYFEPRSASHRAIRAQPLEFSATIVPGAPTPAPSLIAGIAGDPGYKLVQLIQDDTDLVFRTRLRASELRLRSPAIQLTGVLTRGDSATIAGAHTGSELQLRHHGAGRQLASTMPLSVGLAWSFLTPVDVRLGRWVPIASALWLAVLIFPAGYWTAIAWPGSRATLALLALIIVTLLLVPPFMGAAWTRPAEWLGAVAGTALGALTSRLVRRE